MRHTVEEGRKMRNARKKKKRLQNTELKRSALIENALRDVHAKVDRQRDTASKYYKLWRRSVEMNKRIRNILNQRETVKRYIKILNFICL
jgi:hypothetical protein